MGARSASPRSRWSILTVDYGHPPWVAFLLAGSFGTYGLAKKKAGVDAVESLTFETLAAHPDRASAYLLWLSAQGDANFAGHGVGPLACCWPPPAWSRRSR